MPDWRALSGRDSSGGCGFELLTAEALDNLPGGDTILELEPEAAFCGVTL